MKTPKMQATGKTFKQTVVIKTKSEFAPDLEILAEEILAVAEAFRKIERSRLKRQTILILLRAACPSVNMGQIEQVLDACAAMDKKYLK